jgi:hypothetical protein
MKQMLSSIETVDKSLERDYHGSAQCPDWLGEGDLTIVIHRKRKSAIAVEAKYLVQAEIIMQMAVTIDMRRSLLMHFRV